MMPSMSVAWENGFATRGRMLRRLRTVEKGRGKVLGGRGPLNLALGKVAESTGAFFRVLFSYEGGYSLH